MSDKPECVREWVEALERAIDEAEWHGEHADYPDRIEEGKADAARLRSLRDALMQGQEAWKAPVGFIFYNDAHLRPEGTRPVLVLPIEPK